MTLYNSICLLHNDENTLDYDKICITIEATSCSICKTNTL